MFAFQYYALSSPRIQYVRACWYGHHLRIYRANFIRLCAVGCFAACDIDHRPFFVFYRKQKLLGPTWPCG